MREVIMNKLYVLCEMPAPFYRTAALFAIQTAMHDANEDIVDADVWDLNFELDEKQTEGNYLSATFIFGKSYNPEEINWDLTMDAVEEYCAAMGVTLLVAMNK